MFDEHHQEPQRMHISPFNVVALREIGVLMIAIVNFDLVVGPQSLVFEVVRGSKFLRQIENPVTLSEIYTGYARTDVENLELVNEKVVLARHFNKDSKQTDTPTLLFISCLKTADIEKVSRIARTLLLKTDGHYERIDQVLRDLFKEIKDDSREEFQIADETFIVENRSILKENGPKFKNVNGFILVDTKFNKVDARFMPLWIGRTKLDAYEIVEFVMNQKSSYGRKEPVLSMLFKGLQLLVLSGTSASNKRGLCIVITKLGKNLNLDTLEFWITRFLDVVFMNKTLLNNTNRVFSTLYFIETYSKSFLPSYIGKDLLSLLLEANNMIPENLVHKKLLASFEMPIFDLDASITPEILTDFNGSNSLLQLSEKYKVDLPTLATFTLFCVSRGLIVLLRGKSNE